MIEPAVIEDVAVIGVEVVSEMLQGIVVVVVAVAAVVETGTESVKFEKL